MGLDRVAWGERMWIWTSNTVEWGEVSAYGHKIQCDYRDVGWSGNTHRYEYKK